VQRSDLAGWAEYGYCASHSRFFWGLRLHLVTTVHGLPVGWALTGAKADERQALADVLAAARSFISDLGAMLTAVRRAPVPTLCAVDGYCLGGAMELTMACDLRVASTTAVFGMPEIKVGAPSVLDAALLQQHLGLAKAKEMLLTGDLYRGAELEPLGFVNKVVAPEDLHEATAGFARRVSGHSPVAFASQKRLFETWQNVGLQASIDASIGEFAEVFAHETTQERIRCYWDLSD
jgi:enoyl-CoA hydratase/carnithine racemase